MKLSCDEATCICDKSQYKEASFFEKIKLNLHLLLCKKCGMYTKQNGIMSKCIEKYKHREHQKKCCLSAEEKGVIEQQLKNKKEQLKN
jgi:glutamate synthase domain-containing protein 2